MTCTPPPAIPPNLSAVASDFQHLGIAPGLKEEAEGLATLLKSPGIAKFMSAKSRGFAEKMVDTALNTGKLSPLQRLWLRFMLEQALLVRTPVSAIYGTCVRCGTNYGLMTATNDKFCASCVSELAD